MKRILSFIFCLIGWFALIAQYYLLLENATNSFWESTIRFFSFFTILTNLIVAIYFTAQVLKPQSAKNTDSGTLTSITIYICIVGIVYQIILRSSWNPQGLQKLVDELLHSVIPVLTIIYWYLYENKSNLHYKQIFKWAVYPLLYFIFITIRGSFSGFYPYPFVDVNIIGFAQVLMNAFWVLVFFVGLSMIFILTGKSLK
ncbi:Pr6Pr family membrane protein [Chryseobacterium tongliaoense]|uniref:Pr6Pr family membrane protein n=1 Tax=Chryseobacterium tongliaoense TaxID=3240933 RepID=UPI003510E9E2